MFDSDWVAVSYNLTLTITYSSSACIQSSRTLTLRFQLSISPPAIVHGFNSRSVQILGIVLSVLVPDRIVHPAGNRKGPEPPQCSSSHHVSFWLANLYEIARTVTTCGGFTTPVSSNGVQGWSRANQWHKMHQSNFSFLMPSIRNCICWLISDF